MADATLLSLVPALIDRVGKLEAQVEVLKAQLADDEDDDDEDDDEPEEETLSQMLGVSEDEIERELKGWLRSGGAKAIFGGLRDRFGSKEKTP